MTSDLPTQDGTGICQRCGRVLTESEEICSACAVTSEETIAMPPGGSAGGAPGKVAGYRILRELGSGGMGSVFEAFEEGMNRKVALKILARRLSFHEQAGRRFEQEAWLAGRLAHPNIVKVYERGTDGDISYYSMELVDGGSVHDVIRRMIQWGRDKDRQLTFGSHEYMSWAIEQVMAAARGLDYAHRQGIVHRDIKPMNLLLGAETGTIKIADFGLAVDIDATRMTTDGKVMGTLGYMAPEQLLGHKDQIDPRTDVYALGVTLFELLTLELPYRGKTQELYMNAVLTGEARRPSKLNEKVSRDLEVVIGKAIEKERDDRYASAAALADDLENVLNFRPIKARPPSLPARVAKWGRRKPVHAILAVVLAVGVPLTGYLTYRGVEHGRLVREQQVEDLWDQARHYGRTWQFRRAVEGATEVLAIDPSHVEALRMRALHQAEIAVGATDEGEKSLLMTAALADARQIAELEPAVAWPHDTEAFILDRFGREEEAGEARQRAAALRTAERTVNDYYFDGLLASHAAEHQQAVELFSEMILLRPSSSEAYALRGFSHELLQSFEAAEADYKFATALTPDNYENYVLLGRLYTRFGPRDEGTRVLERSLELAPGSVFVHEALSENLLARGREAMGTGEAGEAARLLEEAENMARQGLEVDAASGWARVNLGATLLERNRLGDVSGGDLVTEAIGEYEKAFAAWGDGIPPDAIGAYAAALTNLCDAFLQLGNVERAVELGERAASLEAGDPVTFYNLAAAYALAGRSDDAFTALERDFELGDADFAYLEGDALFESVHGDPRFADIIDRMRQAVGGGK